MAKNASALTMSTEEQICLKSWESAHSTPQQVVLRCRMLLGTSEGKTNQALAAQLNVNRHTVELWRQRGARRASKGSGKWRPGGVVNHATIRCGGTPSLPRRCRPNPRG